MPTTAALYLRVSTEEQSREGYSIPAQRDRLLAFCQAQEWAVYDIYVEEGASGAKLDRPELTRLREDARGKKFDLVLVWKVDRLSRKVAHLAGLVEEFDRSGVAFRSVTEPFDTSHAAGRAFMQMLGVFAELERENIRERSKLGIRKRVQQGFIHGRPPMLGYRRVEKGRWEVDPEGAAIVRWIFDQYLAGVGSFRLAQMLKRGDIPGLSNERLKEEFGQVHVGSTADRIRWILKNPVYAGYAPIGGEVYPGRHEAIIPVEKWQKARDLMASRQSIPNRAHTSTYILSGRIFCGVCGGHMFGRRDRPKTKPVPNKYYEYYICEASSLLRGKSGKCPNWSVRTTLVESKVLEAIRNLAVNPEAALIKQAVADEELQALQAERRSILSSLSQIERRQRKWFEAFESDPALEETALARIRELADNQKSLAVRLAELEKQLRNHGSTMDREEAIAFLKNVAGILDQAGPDQLREIIRSLVRRVVVTPTGRMVKGNTEKEVRVEFYPL